MRTFFLAVKKNNSCCLEPPAVIMTNHRKQNPDSYQYPCNYYDRGVPSSAVLRGFKGNGTAEDGNRCPSGYGSTGQGSDPTMSPCTHPRQLPKVLRQQLSPDSPRTKGDLPNFSSQGKKCVRVFSSFPEILA